MLFVRLERLGERLEDYLTEPAHPSLLHGDLWTGNVLVRGDRIAGFVDPAIYCGHPEIELAFTTMFGTFGQAFFEAYEALSPLEPASTSLVRYLQSLPDARACAAVRGSVSPGGRANLVTCRSLEGKKRTGPEIPGRSSLRNEPNSKGIAY